MKIDRDEVLKLIDNRKFISLLTEIQSDHEKVKETVMKHIEVLEHLFHFQISKM